MDDYAGRVLADRYRLPLPPADEYELVSTRAFDTYSGQEVHIRQIPLPEVVDAEVVDDEAPYGGRGPGREAGRQVRTGDPAVRRAVDAATAAARLPDHPRLDQVFHVFAEAGSLWIVSELVVGRPLAALLAEHTLSPHRAAEVAADVLTALNALHAHGWVHRNITARTVLVCEDGRAMLTGLAAGAAEEALCGYDPVPEEPPVSDEDAEGADDAEDTATAGAPAPTATATRPARAEAAEKPFPPHAPPPAPSAVRPGGRTQALYRDQGAAGGFPVPRPAAPEGDRPPFRDGTDPDSGGGSGTDFGPRSATPPGIGVPLPSGWEPAERPGGPAAPGDGPAPASSSEGEGPHEGRPEVPARAQRAGAIAAYRAGARAAAARANAEANGGRNGATANGAAPDGAWGRTAGDSGPDVALPPPPGTGTGVEAAPEADTGERAGTDAPLSRRPGGWDEAGGRGGQRGPTTALAAERARQARIFVVGAVTERWAPEQAGPVHENWQLAPPVGPATDLWAVGVLLFRAVQGHAPYPEENAAELVQMVCAEAPAYAEDCGALRPVVESLMRQDPTERPEFEELRGWLRSLIRSAPEPDVGNRAVTVPSIGAGGASDPRRLPIVRRRGWLVRRGRATGPVAAPPPPRHGRHKRSKQDRPDSAPRPAAARAPRAPRSLGRIMLVVILLVLAAALLYALLFMPHSSDGDGKDRGGSRPTPTAGPSDVHNSSPGGGKSQGQNPQSTGAPGVEKGFVVRDDPGGFKVAVPKNWTRRAENSRGQIRYVGGDFELVVVPGRDKASDVGDDPMAYQQKREPELSAFRSSAWSSSSGLRRIDVGETAMAEGTFSWRDSSGRSVYGRNLAMLLGGRYHIVQVIGPADEQRAVSRYFDQATSTYAAAD